MPNSSSVENLTDKLTTSSLFGAHKNLITVDISDYQISNDSAASLITYSLGSCIGVTIWDPAVRIGGMLHYMLPDSSISPDKAKNNPAMFGDIGIPILFKSAFKLGANKQRLIVKIAGGSQLLDDQGTFNIGKRNYVMLRQIFWKNNVLIDAEDIGGSISRTMKLNIKTGKVTIKNRNREIEL